jgi:hypothetical protein
MKELLIVIEPDVGGSTRPPQMPIRPTTPPPPPKK